MKLKLVISNMAGNTPWIGLINVAIGPLELWNTPWIGLLLQILILIISSLIKQSKRSNLKRWNLLCARTLYQHTLILLSRSLIVWDVFWNRFYTHAPALTRAREFYHSRLRSKQKKKGIYLRQWNKTHAFLKRTFFFFQDKKDSIFSYEANKMRRMIE